MLKTVLINNRIRNNSPKSSTMADTNQKTEQQESRQTGQSGDQNKPVAGGAGLKSTPAGSDATSKVCLVNGERGEMRDAGE